MLSKYFIWNFNCSLIKNRWPQNGTQLIKTYPTALNMTSKKNTNALVRVIFQPYCQRIVLQNLAVTEWEWESDGGGGISERTDRK